MSRFDKLSKLFVESFTSAGVSSIRPTQSIMYVPLQVNTSQQYILLIVQYKCIKSCSEHFYSPKSDPPHKIMRYWAYYSTQLVFGFPPDRISQVEMICIGVYQFWKGISAGPALKFFAWFIGAGGNMQIYISDSTRSHFLVTCPDSYDCWLVEDAEPAARFRHEPDCCSCPLVRDNVLICLRTDNPTHWVPVAPGQARECDGTLVRCGTVAQVDWHHKDGPTSNWGDLWGHWRV